ncbi:MAG: DUF1499 domain-containing protein [Bdellovibrionales bacterium]|nr:DUF1499 domain-containing protein [Bdellovibrionales bacterium]
MPLGRLTKTPDLLSSVILLGAIAMLGGCAALTINDISTDTVDPPVLLKVDGTGNWSTPLNYPSGFAATQLSAYPEISTRRYSLSPSEAFILMKRVIKEFPRCKLVRAEEGADSYLQAVATTRLIRFNDDVVVRLRTRDSETLVDIRSKSRVGSGDFGANAARIKQLFDRFEAIAHASPAKPKL